jgi:antirestriction protein ArdC
MTSLSLPSCAFGSSGIVRRSRCAWEVIMTGDVSSGSSFNVYRAITEKIAAAIAAGAGSFQMPWHGGASAIALPTNAATNATYRGVNILALWVDAMTKNYPTGHWASYRQWQSIGAQVRKGERGSMIVFYKRVESAEETEDDEGAQPRFFARASRVFNAAQVEDWDPPLPQCVSSFQIDKEVEAFVTAIGARVRHGFTTARYRPDLDDIEMPSPAWFTGTATSSPSQSYHSVLMHETIHWSGAPHRLDREFGKRFGDHAYAFEEIVAELGAAFLCAALGIANEPRPDHAAYVASWLTVLNNDPRAIFTAANRAQQAAEYLAQLAASNGGW